MSETEVEERSHRLWRFRPGSIRAAPSPRSTGLRVLDWRSEILQAMFWLENEGFGDEVDAALLERFLGGDSHVDVQDLDRLTQEGYVERVGRRYKLSETGTRKARLEFAASFEGFTRPASAECSRAAWCKSRLDM